MPGGETIAALLIEIDADDKASAKIDGVTQKIDTSAKSTTSYSEKIGNAATSFATFGHSVDRVMNMFDRYEITQLTIENSTTRVTVAQQNLNEAITKFGPNSQQAVDASRQLDVAQNNLERTNIRAQSSMVMIGLAAVSMVPQMLTASGSFLTFAASGTVMVTMSKFVTLAFGAMTAGVRALTAAIVANPIGAAIVLIIGAIIALKYAWDTNFMGIQQLAGAVFEFIEHHFKWLADIISGVISTLGILTGAQDTTKSSTKQLDGAMGELNTTMGTNATVTANASFYVIAFEEKLKSQGLTSLQVKVYMDMLNKSGIDVNQTLGELAINSLTAGTKQAELRKEVMLAKLELDKQNKALAEGADNLDAVIAAEDRYNKATKVASDYTREFAGAFDYLASKGISASQTIVAAMEAAGRSFDEMERAYRIEESYTPPEANKRLTIVDWGTGRYNASTEEGLIAMDQSKAQLTALLEGKGFTEEIISKAFAKPGIGVPYARGGIVPGIGNTDSVLAALTPGEIVLPKNYDLKYGKNINVINNFNAPIYGINDLEAAIKNTFDNLKWQIKAAGGY